MSKGFFWTLWIILVLILATILFFIVSSFSNQFLPVEGDGFVVVEENQ